MKIYRTNRKWHHSHRKLGREHWSSVIFSDPRRIYEHIHRFAFLGIGVTLTYREVIFDTEEKNG